MQVSAQVPVGATEWPPLGHRIDSTAEIFFLKAEPRLVRDKHLLQWDAFGSSSACRCSKMASSMSLHPPDCANRIDRAQARLLRHPNRRG